MLDSQVAFYTKSLSTGGLLVSGGQWDCGLAPDSCWPAVSPAPVLHYHPTPSWSCPGLLSRPGEGKEDALFLGRNCWLWPSPPTGIDLAANASWEVQCGPFLLLILMPWTGSPCACLDSSRILYPQVLPPCPPSQMGLLFCLVSLCSHPSYFGPSTSVSPCSLCLVLHTVFC